MARPYKDRLLRHQVVVAEQPPKKMLRIGYVPEHFCSPLLQLAEVNDEIQLVSQPSGTGQMMTSLKDGTIDVAIALTESLIAGIAKGATHFKLVGSYVTTPLNWAVITGAKSQYNSIDDLRNTTIGISRVGSGSQVMAYVMALKHSWADKQTQPQQFEVLDSFKGLRDGVNSGKASCFMWEHFTTKPFKDSGEVRFIGNVLTPWPSWMICCTPQSDKKQVASFLSELSKYTTRFDSAESRQSENIAFIEKQFGYEHQDILDWQDTVKFSHDTRQVPQKVLFDTLKTLETAGAIEAKDDWQLDQFIDTEIAKVV